ncbi:hypothetical protein BJV74DRAFT_842440 [Russula compacta]|nr:hypothetical protein BJV74DRAFT_842440 [Russula compacta]
MFKLFSSGPSASNSSLPKETIPGGPSPDSALPSYHKPMDTRHQASPSVASAGARQAQAGRMSGSTDGASRREPGVDIVYGPSTPSYRQDLTGVGAHGVARQPSQHLTIPDTSVVHPYEHPYSDTVRENDPAVVAANSGAAEGGKDTRRSVSTASRRTNRNLAATTPKDVDPSLQARTISADEELTQGEKAAISKSEHGVSRKLSKIMKSEAKAEKAALHIALKELAEIQKLQKASIEEEAVSHSRHSRALSDAHKAEMGLLAARTENERGQASLRAAGEVLEASRRHARETTEMLREKMGEVEHLRIHKQVDDRERAIKVKSLGREGGRRLSKILRSG